jgi:hypothetical protein
MHFFARRLEVFNRDDLPDWQQSPNALRRVLLIVSSIAEYFLFYLLALLGLAALVVLMVAGWIIGVDRRST